MNRDTRHPVCSPGQGVSMGQGAVESHHAGWIIVHKDRVIQNGYVVSENGIIRSVQQEKPGGNIIDHGPGVLMPALVNTHLHLELSALHRCVNAENGFRLWVADLLAKREALGTDALIRGAEKSIRDLENSGHFLLGDISTLGITHDLIQDSDLGGVSFFEYLGNFAETVAVLTGHDCSRSLAGHAPHTTAPDFLKSMKAGASAQSLPFSIHAAESEDEMEFIRTGRGAWAEFLLSRGIDFSGWEIRGKTPLEHLANAGLLDAATIVVHALRATASDLDLLKASCARVCLCPRSNLTLHGLLPDIAAMMRAGLKPALGTDSLASCDSLDILDEMRFVKSRFPDIPSDQIFEMGTVNGAKALNADHMAGTLEEGKKLRMVYLPLPAEHPDQLFDKMVTYE